VKNRLQPAVRCVLGSLTINDDGAMVLDKFATPNSLFERKL